MGSVRIAALAAVAALAIASGAAVAADFPCQPQYPGGPMPPHCACQPQFPGGPVPPHCMAPPPPPVIEEFGGWYIRGDIGMTNQAVGELFQANFPTTPGLVVIDKNFEAGMLFGVGVGYKWNNWLRFDVTGEYRGETGFHGLDTWNDGTARFNNYTGKKSEWLFLANVYADLGTWSGFTPFIGAGLGFSRIGIHSLRDLGTDGTNVTLGTAGSAFTWNFAYALHAGVSWELTKHTSLEFAYRYTYLGDGISGPIRAFDGSSTISGLEFRDIDSHDLKLAFRYFFASNTGYQFQVPEVLMRRY